MNSQNTQQLTDEIQKETSQSLNNSESGGVSANDGTSGDNHHDLHSNIDLNKTEFNDGSAEKELQNFPQGIPPKNKNLESCVLTDDGMICH
ncbi:hypothetical protein [Nostoc sp. FACHB-133]|uniref:hypothetical protein n=1 Tax=Nostoc sp. FACHB-133 TaxID=2692835 RepID=UPI0016848221|nr:hypothetical protein [Nostoc sp. FACHB-133]MBD2525124.1 hypothetical protein [Nostoc sp. FACHB-133]